MRFHYSLKFCVVVVTLFSLLLGYAAFVAQRACDQRRSVLAIQQKGGFVQLNYEMDHPSPSRISRLWRGVVGRHVFSEVTGVYFFVDKKSDHGAENTLHSDDVDFSDDDLILLDPFPELKELSLCGTNITNCGVSHLTRFKNIQILSLGNTSVDDGCVKYLAQMKQLGVLSLMETGVSVQGFKTLKKELLDTQIWHPADVDAASALYKNDGSAGAEKGTL